MFCDLGGICLAISVTISVYFCFSCFIKHTHTHIVLLLLLLFVFLYLQGSQICGVLHSINLLKCSGNFCWFCSVSFEDVHRLGDGQVKHSPEVFYAGSLWKVTWTSINHYIHLACPGMNIIYLFESSGQCTGF